MLLLLACATPPTLPDLDGQAGACVSLRGERRWLAAEQEGYAWSASVPEQAARFTLQASDLATYLLYDAEGGYLVSDDGPLLRQTRLDSDVTLLQDDYVSGAEWLLEASEHAEGLVVLRNRRNDAWLGRNELTTRPRRAERIELVAAEGCLTHPELSLDATGAVTKTTWEDGDLYGVADAHSHLMSDLSFGGFLFHGGAYHRLGVQHALGDCDRVHGAMGRKDFFGYVYDSAGNNNDNTDILGLVGDLASGELSEDNHQTEGWPTFTDWPDGPNRATHQVQYYRWLERAWMGGLRLVVQHATSNSVICNLTVGEGLQPSRYDCDDMTAVDRIIDETWALQDYVDAQSGGLGQGWFRVVESPAEAREVIAEGKLAVVIGIETSDLFRCNLTPRPGGPVCDEDYVLEQLDAYYARGVRALFPVHKYDNALSPGDGSGAFIELGNFFNSGHYTNMTEDCPADVPSGFDGGAISFGGLLEPREDYLSAAPVDMSGFPDDPLETAMEHASVLFGGSVDGDWCQNATMTPAGEALLLGMMERGMIIEVDHLPMWSYVRAYELLEQYDYPAAGTHGRHWNGRLYALGGVSTAGPGRCQNAEDPGSTMRGYLDRVALKEQMGGYPSLPMGLDLNGFAHAPRPRFGENGCSSEQPNPIEYPFASYAGDVTFSEPWVGDRALDFNTEGLVHIGLLPELLQDARADAVSDEDLEPLFRSAEAYVRMWEKAEERGAALTR